VWTPLNRPQDDHPSRTVYLSNFNQQNDNEEKQDEEEDGSPETKKQKV